MRCAQMGQTIQLCGGAVKLQTETLPKPTTRPAPSDPVWPGDVDADVQRMYWRHHTR